VPADTWLSGSGPLCDRFFDDRVSAATGFLAIPDPPAPTEISGPDGRRHVLRYRICRAPTGIAVELHEDIADGGFEFAVLGDHDADVATLVAAVRVEAQREISRSYLEPSATGVGWRAAGSEVVVRIEVGAEDQPRVVVDGRPLSWDELGEALESSEGLRFRLIVEDRITDLRSAKD
jgi:hypothetical protein